METTKFQIHVEIPTKIVAEVSGLESRLKVIADQLLGDDSLFRTIPAKDKGKPSRRKLRVQDPQKVAASLRRILVQTEGQEVPAPSEFFASWAEKQIEHSLLEALVNRAEQKTPSKKLAGQMKLFQEKYALSVRVELIQTEVEVEVEPEEGDLREVHQEEGVQGEGNAETLAVATVSQDSGIGGSDEEDTVLDNILSE